jgi:hypothetical protein
MSFKTSWQTFKLVQKANAKKTKPATAATDVMIEEALL